MQESVQQFDEQVEDEANTPSRGGKCNSVNMVVWGRNQMGQLGIDPQ